MTYEVFVYYVSIEVSYALDVLVFGLLLIHLKLAVVQQYRQFSRFVLDTQLGCVDWLLRSNA